MMGDEYIFIVKIYVRIKKKMIHATAAAQFIFPVFRTLSICAGKVLIRISSE